MSQIAAHQGMAHLHFLGRSKHHFQRELDLARIDSCAGDDAIVRLTQLSAGRIPDRMIRQIEGLRSKFHVFRLADSELLTNRGVEVNDARTDNRVPRGVAITKLRSKWKPVHECIRVEKMSSGPLASWKVRVGCRRIGITCSTTVLNVSRTT